MPTQAKTILMDIRAATEAHQKFLSLVRRSAPAPCSANRGRRRADETPLAAAEFWRGVR